MIFFVYEKNEMKFCKLHQNKTVVSVEKERHHKKWILKKWIAFAKKWWIDKNDATKSDWTLILTVNNKAFVCNSCRGCL